MAWSPPGSWKCLMWVHYKRSMRFLLICEFLDRNTIRKILSWRIIWDMKNLYKEVSFFKKRQYGNAACLSWINPDVSRVRENCMPSLLMRTPTMNWFPCLHKKNTLKNKALCFMPKQKQQLISIQKDTLKVY